MRKRWFVLSLVLLGFSALPGRFGVAAPPQGTNAGIPWDQIEPISDGEAKWINQLRAKGKTIHSRNVTRYYFERINGDLVEITEQEFEDRQAKNEQMGDVGVQSAETDLVRLTLSITAVDNNNEPGGGTYPSDWFFYGSYHWDPPTKGKDYQGLTWAGEQTIKPGSDAAAMYQWTGMPGGVQISPQFVVRSEVSPDSGVVWGQTTDFFNEWGHMWVEVYELDWEGKSGNVVYKYFHTTSAGTSYEFGISTPGGASGSISISPTTNQASKMTYTTFNY